MDWRGSLRHTLQAGKRCAEARKALGFAVALTCRSIGTSPSAHYQRATGQLSTRAQQDERLLAEIRRVFKANYEAYGSLRVWKALKRKGVVVGRGRVERLMAANGLVGAKRRGRAWKTTIADPEGCERPDLVNRDFTASRPDARWIADFTYLKSWEGAGSLASSWTSTAGAAWAGSSRATCAPTWC
jgi:putative transposase